MGRHSSDSDSSSYSRKKKSRRHRSSSLSSSSSRYSSRSKRSKKSKKLHRSRSHERSHKDHKKSRDKRSTSRTRKSKHSKHSRRRSRSSSRSKYSSRSDSKDRRSPSYSRSRRKSYSRSPSYSSRSHEKKNSLFDGAELLAKLNKAATEAMSENSRKLEDLFNENQESRYNAINEINAPDFIQKSFCTSDNKCDAPAVAESTNFISFNNAKEEPGSLLHPNLLIEDELEKTNRWVRKLFQIRQKIIYESGLGS